MFYKEIKLMWSLVTLTHMKLTTHLWPWRSFYKTISFPSSSPNAFPYFSHQRGLMEVNLDRYIKKTMHRGQPFLAAVLLTFPCTSKCFHFTPHIHCLPSSLPRPSTHSTLNTIKKENKCMLLISARWCHFCGQPRVECTFLSSETEPEVDECSPFAFLPFFCYDFFFFFFDLQQEANFHAPV